MHMQAPAPSEAAAFAANLQNVLHNAAKPSPRPHAPLAPQQHMQPHAMHPGYTAPPGYAPQRPPMQQPQPRPMQPAPSPAAYPQPVPQLNPQQLQALRAKASVDLTRLMQPHLNAQQLHYWRVNQVCCGVLWCGDPC